MTGILEHPVRSTGRSPVAVGCPDTGESPDRAQNITLIGRDGHSCSRPTKKQLSMCNCNHPPWPFSIFYPFRDDGSRIGSGRRICRQQFHSSGHSGKHQMEEMVTYDPPFSLTWASIVAYPLLSRIIYTWYLPFVRSSPNCPTKLSAVSKTKNKRCHC